MNLFDLFTAVRATNPASAFLLPTTPELQPFKQPSAKSVRVNAVALPAKGWGKLPEALKALVG